jgi:hypothetical protein
MLKWNREAKTSSAPGCSAVSAGVNRKQAIGPRLQSHALADPDGIVARRVHLDEVLLPARVERNLHPARRPEAVDALTLRPGLVRSFQSLIPFGLPLRTRSTTVEV